MGLAELSGESRPALAQPLSVPCHPLVTQALVALPLQLDLGRPGLASQDASSQRVFQVLMLSEGEGLGSPRGCSGLRGRSAGLGARDADARAAMPIAPALPEGAQLARALGRRNRLQVVGRSM